MVTTENTTNKAETLDNVIALFCKSRTADSCTGGSGDSEATALTSITFLLYRPEMTPNP